MPASLTDYRHLLELYALIPKPANDLTFMQIAGYPHYENVCSNILKFYLDPDGEHGLGDLLLRCLVSLHKDEAHYVPSERVDIYREYSTKHQHRIDLVIDTDTTVIAIENKVWHWLANDLEHYADTMDELVAGETDKRTIYKFILAPTKHENLARDFHSITYNELWLKLESELGSYLFQADQKWLNYLLDFIQTTKQFNNITTMEFTDRDKFIIERQDLIHDLVNDRNDLVNRLNQRVMQLAKLVSEDKYIQENILESWVHRKNILVLDFIWQIETIAIDLELTITGWTLRWFGRQKGGTIEFEKVKMAEPMQSLLLKAESKPNRGFTHTWDVTTDLAVIHDELKSIVSTFSEARKKSLSQESEV